MRHQTSKSWLDNDFTFHLIRQNNVHLTAEPERVRTKCRHLAPMLVLQEYRLQQQNSPINESTAVLTVILTVILNKIRNSSS